MTCALSFETQGRLICENCGSGICEECFNRILFTSRKCFFKCDENSNLIFINKSLQTKEKKNIDINEFLEYLTDRNMEYIDKTLTSFFPILEFNKDYLRNCEHSKKSRMILLNDIYMILANLNNNLNKGKFILSNIDNGECDMDINLFKAYNNTIYLNTSVNKLIFSLTEDSLPDFLVSFEENLNVVIEQVLQMDFIKNWYDITKSLSNIRGFCDARNE